MLMLSIRKDQKPLYAHKRKFNSSMIQQSGPWAPICNDTWSAAPFYSLSVRSLVHFM